MIWMAILLVTTPAMAGHAADGLPKVSRTAESPAPDNACHGEIEKRFQAFRCLKAIGATGEELARVVDPDGKGLDEVLPKLDYYEWYDEQKATDRILARFEKFPETFKKRVSVSASWVRAHGDSMKLVPPDLLAVTGKEREAKMAAEEARHVELTKALNKLNDYIYEPAIPKQAAALDGIVTFLKRIDAGSEPRTEAEWRRAAEGMLKRWESHRNDRTRVEAIAVWDPINRAFRESSERIGVIYNLEKTQKYLEEAKAKLASEKPNALKGLKACQQLGDDKIKRGAEAAMVVVDTTPLVEQSRR